MERKKKDFDKNTTLQKDISAKLLAFRGKQQEIREIRIKFSIGNLNMKSIKVEKTQ